PLMFNVNEPITFGAPLILSPIFLIPFFIAPIANTILIRFFITTLGMNGFIMEVPWTTPGFIGAILGTNFDPLSFLLVPLIAIVDGVIYYPFFKVYDQQVLADEEQEELSENDNEEVEVEIAMDGPAFSTTVSREELENVNDQRTTMDKEEINVLVLCAGGGTSGMLANTLNNNSDDLKDEYGVSFTARGGHYGQHGDLIEEADVVILAPQVSSHLENMKKE